MKMASLETEMPANHASPNRSACGESPSSRSGAVIGAGASGDLGGLPTTKNPPESEAPKLPLRSVIARRPPTARQKQVLQVIVALSEVFGHAPTVRELVGVLEVSSNNTVACLLDALKRRGWVTWVPHKARTLKLTDDGRAVIG